MNKSVRRLVVTMPSRQLEANNFVSYKDNHRSHAYHLLDLQILSSSSIACDWPVNQYIPNPRNFGSVCAR